MPVPAPDAIVAPIFAIAIIAVIVCTPVEARALQITSAVVSMKITRIRISPSAFYVIPPLPRAPAFVHVLILQRNHFQLPTPFFGLMPIKSLITQDFKLACLDGLAV